MDIGGHMQPMLIGMNNPISTRPGHELYPLPEGCTGHRLWGLLAARTKATMREYCDVFERRNLVRGPVFNITQARARAFEIVVELRDSDRVVVLLGQEVRRAFDFALDGNLPRALAHPQYVGGCTWRQIPHPSAANAWYRHDSNRNVIELLMEELYVGYKRRQETATFRAAI